MDLYDYFLLRRKKDHSFREVQFARQIKISRNYLSLIKNGLLVPSIKLAKKIEEASFGEVNAFELIEKNYDIKNS